MDNNGSEIRKVSRCTPTVKNETILATTQEFFFTKAGPGPEGFCGGHEIF